MSRIIDETGNKYGRLTVLEYSPTTGGQGAQWLCKCECGKEVIVSGINLRRGKTKSCGCLQKEIQIKNLLESPRVKTQSPFLIDETGNRYGKLLVLERDNNNPGVYWKCLCDCGKITSVSAKHLRNGSIISCGCSINEAGHNPNFIDETGNKYGKWTVLKKDENYHRHTHWICKCECGTIASVLGASLRQGKSLSCGCIKSRGEYKISQLLTDRKILFEKEKRFPECFDKDMLPFDFYLPEYNICIEFQGEQHYKENTYFGAEAFQITLKHDTIKAVFCQERGINLQYISYLDDIEMKLKEILGE